MKSVNRVIAMMLVIITLFALLPIYAVASPQYDDLKFNNWYKVNQASSDLTVYHIKVSSETVISFKLKGDNDFYFCVDIFKDRECKKYYSEVDVRDNNNMGGGFVLYPGSYYFVMYSNDGKNVQVTFQKKKVSSVNKQNYCIKNAISIKKNKSYCYAQTKGYCYKRWYKIKLTKSQKIHITFVSNIYPDFKLYDSNFSEIKYVDDFNTFTSYGKLKKGTYYLEIEDGFMNYLKAGQYFTFLWK